MAMEGPLLNLTLRHGEAIAAAAASETTEGGSAGIFGTITEGKAAAAVAAPRRRSLQLESILDLDDHLDLTCEREPPRSPPA